MARQTYFTCDFSEHVPAHGACFTLHPRMLADGTELPEMLRKNEVDCCATHLPQLLMNILRQDVRDVGVKRIPGTDLVEFCDNTRTQRSSSKEPCPLCETGKPYANLSSHLGRAHDARRQRNGRIFSRSTGQEIQPVIRLDDLAGLPELQDA